MIDPRRSLTRDNDRLETSYLKTFGLTAAVALGGIRLHSRFANQRAVLLNAVSSARERYEKVATIFYRQPTPKLPPSEMETIRAWNLKDTYNALDDWKETLAEEGLDILDGTTIDELRDVHDQFGAEIREIIEKVEDINKRIIGIPLTPAELGEAEVRRRSVNTLSKIEKDYPGIGVILNRAAEQHGISVQKIDSIGTSYRIHIHDGGRKDIIELPKFKAGIVNWKGSNYKPQPTAAIAPDIIRINSFGFNVMARMEEQLKFLKGPSPAAQLKRMLDSVISINLGKYVDNGHVMKHLLTEEFIFEDLAKAFGTPSAAKEEALSILPRILERSRIYMQMGGKEGLIDIHHSQAPRVGKGSIRSISESSFLKYSAISEIPVGIWPFTSFSKVSQSRANYMAGRMLRQRMKIREIAAKLGPTSRDVLIHLSRNMSQDLPGKMTNVGFYFGLGEIQGVGKGGSMWINRYFKNLDGSLSKKMNISAYTGVYHRRVSIPMFNIAGANMKDMLVGVNDETKKLLTDLHSRKGDIVLKKGTWLGQRGSKDAFFVENDMKVRSVHYDRGYLELYVDEEIPLHVGSKVDQGKMMIQRVVMGEQLKNKFSKLNSDGRFMAEILGQDLGAETAVELLTNGKMAGKYEGGALGWGLIQKVMNDLVQVKKDTFTQKFRLKTKFQGGEIGRRTVQAELRKMTGELRELLRTTLGANVDDIIETVSIAPDTFEPVVILKPWNKMPDKSTVSTANAAFAKVLDIEKAISDAQERGDWRGLIQLEKRLQKHFKSVGLPQYRLIVDVPEHVEDFTKLTKGFSPTFVRSIHTDGSKAWGRLIYFSIRTPAMAHQSGTYEYMSFAGLTRGKTGYLGGFKATMDHIENAQAAGLKHYVQYLHMLMDHNVDYIRDKMFAAEQRMFGATPNLDGAHVKMAGVNTITLDTKLPDGRSFNDLLERLAEYRVSDDSLKAAGRFRIIAGELSGLQGLVDDDAYSRLLNTRVLDLEDIRSTTKAGMGRYSVDVTDKNLVHDLVSMVNQSRNKNEAIYIELPTQVTIGGIDVKYVPIHNFDKADMFELVAERSPDGMWLGERMTKKFYTGSEFYSNQMYFLKRIGEISKELRISKGDRRKSQDLGQELKHAVESYYNNLRNSMKGKFSNIRSAIFEHRMPFSTKGIVNSLEQSDVGDYRVQGIQGIPTDSVYMHEDDIAKLISGGKVRSMRQARSMVEYVESLKGIQERLKGLPLDKLDTVGSDDLLKIVTQSGRALQRIDYDILDEGRDGLTKRIVKESQYWRKKLGKSSKAPASREDREALEGLVKDIKRLVVNEIPSDTQLADTAAIYRYTLNTIEQMKQGTLDLGGKLVGSPELSQLSMNHFKLKVIQSNEFSQKTMNQFMHRQISNLKKFFQKFEGRIYGPKEMIDAMSRDFDFDPIGFVITTLDTIERESNKITGFSIMKEAGIFGKGSNKAAMEVFHHLSEETLHENILSRLGIFEQVTGQPLGATFKPASTTAVTVMHSLKDAMEEGRLLTRDLKGYVTESLTKLYGSEQVAAMAGGTLSKQVDTFIERVLSDVKKFRGKHIAVDDLRVIEGVVPDYGTSEKAQAVERQRVTNWKEFSKKYPDKLHEKLGLKYTEEELLVRDTIIAQNKDLHKQYEELLMRDSERFKLIKSQTPTAYNTSRALMSLSYGYVKDAQQKEFLTLLADKVIAQNTISSKHGTPQVLPDIARTLREISNVNEVVLDKQLDDLSRGNLKVTLTSNEKKQMKQLGFKVEDVDFDAYEQYLDKRESYFAELQTIHNDALSELTKAKDRTREGKVLAQKYRERVSGKIDASKNLKEYGLLNNAYYDDMVVSNELNLVRQAKENAKKFRSEMTMGGLDQTMLKERWKNLATTLREYSYEHQVSVFDDPNLKAFRSQKGRGVNYWDMMFHKIFNKSSQLADDADSHVVRVRNTLEEWVARVAAIISDQHDLKIASVNSETRLDRMKQLAAKEVRTIQSRYADRIAEESTVFRPGSMISTIGKQAVKATGSAIEDATLHRASRLRGSSLLLGLLTGTILGQAVNQVVSGYPVPDLKGTTGLGGEHFDRGVVGREMEVMLKPRPPRVVSAYEEDQRMNRELASIPDAISAYGSQVSTRQFKGSYKGVVLI